MKMHPARAVVFLVSLAAAITIPASLIALFRIATRDASGVKEALVVMLVGYAVAVVAFCVSMLTDRPDKGAPNV